MSSKSFANDETISTKNWTISDVTKNSVNNKPLNNAKYSLNDQQNLGSNSHRVRIENPSRIIFGQVNIKSIRDKLDLLMKIIKNEIYIFMISETKTDNSFTLSQFTMQVTQFLLGLIGQVMGVEYFSLSENIFLAK